MKGERTSIILPTYQEPTIRKEGYLIERKMASTQLSTVYLAKKADEEERVVIKKVEKKTTTCYEIMAGRIFNHPNIVKLYAHFEDETYSYLVFQFVSGLNLFDYLASKEFKVPKSEAKLIFSQLVSALRCVHKLGFAHMDIKLENVMFNPITKKVTLIDFGFCRPITRDCRTFCGSTDYCSPELLSLIPFSNEKADVFSLGIVLHTLFFSVMPGRWKERQAVTERTGQHPPIIIAEGVCKLSKKQLDLLRCMLQMDPNLRPSMKMISKHAWLRGTLRGRLLCHV